MPPKAAAPPPEAEPEPEQEEQVQPEEPAGPTQLDLPDIDSKFSSLYVNLEEEQKARRKLDQQRVIEVREYVQEIEVQLDDEVKVRRESDALLDKLAQSRLDAVQQALVVELRREVKKLHVDLEEAKERIGEAEKALVEAREKSERELKEVKKELVDRLDRIQTTVRAESKVRREEDERINRRYKKEIVDIQELQAAETVVRKDDVRLVRGRLDVLEHQEVKAAERAQLEIFERLRQLRREIQVEKEERLVEEEKVSGTLEEYAVAVKSGLKIVNRNDYK